MLKTCFPHFPPKLFNRAGRIPWLAASAASCFSPPILANFVTARYTLNALIDNILTRGAHGFCTVDWFACGGLYHVFLRSADLQNQKAGRPGFILPNALHLSFRLPAVARLWLVPSRCRDHLGE